MFSYNSSLLRMNDDDTLIHLVVPSGVPIGTRVHNIIYVCVSRTDFFCIMLNLRLVSHKCNIYDAF